MTYRKNRDVTVMALVGMIFLIMAVEIFFLIRQNGDLRAEIKRMRSGEIESIEIGAAAPDFALHSLSGRLVSLSDYQRDNLVLIFFSEECPGCLKDIPNWKRLVALQNNSLHVLGVTQADSENVRSFLASYGLNFDILLDPGGEISKRYKCVSVPQKVLVDPGGRVAFVEKGSVAHNETGEMEQMLRGGK